MDTTKEKLRLKENERIKRYELQHWIVPFRATFGFTIFATIGVLIFLGGLKSLETFELPAKVIMLFGYTTVLVTIHWFMILIFRYLNSRTYITNLRIINFNSVPMIADDITYILIDEIHEIEEHKQGLLRNILNYGKISINLPAMPRAIELYDMKHPERIVDFVEAIRREGVKARGESMPNEELRVSI